MITRPLNLQAHLRRPSKRINPIPLLDVLFIALFFSFLGSNFVLAPGLTLNLPEGDRKSMAGLPTSAFLTVQSENVLLFQGEILKMDELKSALVEHVTKRGESNLVVYLDREVSVQTLLRVTDLAREAGIVRVQVASQPSAAERMPSSDLFLEER